MRNNQYWYALETIKNGRTFYTVFAPDFDSAWDLMFEHAKGVNAEDSFGPYDSSDKLSERIYCYLLKGE